MPLWGWGDAGRKRELPQAAVLELESRLGALPDAEPRLEVEAFATQPPAVSDLARQEIETAAGQSAISTDALDRLVHAGGKSYPDLVRMRGGRPLALPDLVVRPENPAAVQRFLGACSKTNTAVVPFGGGTSVVGGVSPIGEGRDGVVSLDLGRLTGLVSLDRESRIASFLAGTPGPTAEAALAGEGLTVGHFPQSFLFATIGGFVATRSAGQASTGYGRIDSNVLGLSMATPAGPIELPPMPGTAAGPGLRSLLIGSEGTLGVITQAALQVAASPERIEDHAWVVDGFERGRDLLRMLEQHGCAPAVARLSDEEETGVSLALASGSASGRLFARYAARRGGGNPCLMITGFEGTEADVARSLADATALLRANGARHLGTRPGRAWRHGRYDGPYLRDVLMDRGLLVDTLETAAPWSGLERLYSAVSTALRGALSAFGGEPIVMCHVSHLYPGGASLYFTFIGRQPDADPDDRIANWQRVKDAACDAIVGAGGTITHHHAIGTDHSRWMEDEVGSVSLRALAAIKRELDPAGIMNPGKLVNSR